MSKNVRGGYPTVKKILGGKFTRNLNRLYELAVFSVEAEDYSRTNILRYFIRDLKTDIKRDSMIHNLLFIFTDDYIVVGEENNVMLDANNQFPDLKVIVLETAPRNKNYESEPMALQGFLI